MKFNTFSIKQTKILTWWTENSPYKDYDGIICDGSIRAGKTVAMALSFVFWAMETFNGEMFGMSGKSVSSFNRNVNFWLIPALKLRGYKVISNLSEHVLTIKKRDSKTKKIKINYFYYFGGTDERSFQFIQGMTTAGWYFDECALQPESFVNQAIGRCSIDGAKVWFNCNPDKPLHWFKLEYIDKAKEKLYYHLHFIMDDNPSLSEKVKERYKRSFAGVFYLRYILGEWALAEGIIYDMITEENYYESIDNEFKWECTRYIAIDYGTINPLAVYSIYDHWDVAYIDDELYYDSKVMGKQLTDSQMADKIEELIKKDPQRVERIIIDPSAASLKAELRARGYLLKDADNDVLVGIRRTASAIQQRRIKINRRCKNMIAEFGGYIWDSKAQERGVEKPLKEKDHAMDAFRYYVNTIMAKRIDGRM